MAEPVMKKSLRKNGWSRSIAVWLSLVLFLSPTTGVVICFGSDGHVAFETYRSLCHAPDPSSPESTAPSFDQVPTGSNHPSCTDLSLTPLIRPTSASPQHELTPVFQLAVSSPPAEDRLVDVPHGSAAATIQNRIKLLTGVVLLI